MIETTAFDPKELVLVLIAVVGLVLVGFAGEGVVYAVRDPEAVFGRQLIVYFVAAALICTGLGYWLLRHWREFLTAD